MVESPELVYIPVMGSNRLSLLRYYSACNSLVEDVLWPIIRYGIDTLQVRTSTATVVAEIKKTLPIIVLFEPPHPLSASRAMSVKSGHLRPPVFGNLIISAMARWCEDTTSGLWVNAEPATTGLVLIGGLAILRRQGRLV